MSVTEALLFFAALALPLLSVWLIHVTLDAYWGRWWRSPKTRIFMVCTGIGAILATVGGAAVWYYNYHAYNWLSNPLALYCCIIIWVAIAIVASLP